MFNWLHKTSEPLKPKTLGQVGEEIAQKEYEKKGFKVIAKNEYNKKGKRLGEIDFIACKKSVLAFVEVKTRQSEKGYFGGPLEAVDYFKQNKILKAVKMFMLQHPEMAELQPQIDVCAIILPDIDKAPQSVKIYMNAVEDFN